MLAVAALTLPDARAKQQNSIRNVITILMLVSDHPLMDSPDARLP
jgi:hypothetical protein